MFDKRLTCSIGNFPAKRYVETVTLPKFAQERSALCRLYQMGYNRVAYLGPTPRLRNHTSDRPHPS